ncbi:hypothetical protein BJY52DRAFT_1120467, partial [Lactarius psammicola]
ILAALRENACCGHISAMHGGGGIGRTGVVVEDGAAEWKSVKRCRRFPQSPETGGQCDFVRNFERLPGLLVVAI